VLIKSSGRLQKKNTCSLLYKSTYTIAYQIDYEFNNEKLNKRNEKTFHSIKTNITHFTYFLLNLSFFLFLVSFLLLFFSICFHSIHIPFKYEKNAVFIVRHDGENVNKILLRFTSPKCYGIKTVNHANEMQ
jgi:hypothetical protein